MFWTVKLMTQRGPFVAVWLFSNYTSSDHVSMAKCIFTINKKILVDILCKRQPVVAHTGNSLQWTTAHWTLNSSIRKEKPFHLVLISGLVSDVSRWFYNCISLLHYSELILIRVWFVLRTDFNIKKMLWNERSWNNFPKKNEPEALISLNKSYFYLLSLDFL